MSSSPSIHNILPKQELSVLSSISEEASIGEEEKRPSESVTEEQIQTLRARALASENRSLRREDANFINDDEALPEDGDDTYSPQRDSNGFEAGELIDSGGVVCCDWKIEVRLADVRKSSKKR